MVNYSKNKQASFMKQEAELLKPFIESGKKPNVEILVGMNRKKPVYSIYGVAPNLPFGEYELFISGQFGKTFL